MPSDNKYIVYASIECPFCGCEMNDLIADFGDVIICDECDREFVYVPDIVEVTDKY